MQYMKYGIVYEIKTGTAYLTTQGISNFTLIGLSKIKEIAKQLRHLSKFLKFMLL